LVMRLPLVNNEGKGLGKLGLKLYDLGSQCIIVGNGSILVKYKVFILSYQYGS
jgi:hypothetical protein